MIVLTDRNIVNDLMDKRSQVTLGRPPMYAANRVTGGMNMGMAGHSSYTLFVCFGLLSLTWLVAEDWRIFRRVSREILAESACAKHIPIQRAESAQVLHEFLVNPKV
jgi:hypothetical protein